MRIFLWFQDAPKVAPQKLRRKYITTRKAKMLLLTCRFMALSMRAKTTSNLPPKFIPFTLSELFLN